VAEIPLQRQAALALVIFKVLMLWAFRSLTIRRFDE
jgi:hypothetical protein